MAEIRLEAVSKKYDKGAQALKTVDLTVKDKEFLVLLGPSGCGKTTLLRLVAGLEKPTEGSIFFDGEDVIKLDPMERNIAMVFQTFALYPHMNVYKNIAFPLGSIKMPVDEIKEKVEHVARVLDIQHLLNKRPRELSGGEKQRVALARAMVREPVAFLLDEPLSNLDAKMRLEVRSEIMKLHREMSTTFIYVTHDQSEAMQMGERVVVMEEGEIRQIGTPQEVYDHPNSVYVAGFVGAPKINFFATRLHKDEAGIYTNLLGRKVPLNALAFTAPEKIADGQKVILGIRPEDFRPSPASAAAVLFQALAARVVPMGSGIHVSCLLDEKDFLAVLPGHSEVVQGEGLALYLDPTRIHVFDGESQFTLLEVRQDTAVPSEEKEE